MPQNTLHIAGGGKSPLLMPASAHDATHHWLWAIWLCSNASRCHYDIVKGIAKAKSLANWQAKQGKSRVVFCL